MKNYILTIKIVFVQVMRNLLVWFFFDMSESCTSDYPLGNDVFVYNCVVMLIFYIKYSPIMFVTVIYSSGTEM